MVWFLYKHENRYLIPKNIFVFVKIGMLPVSLALFTVCNNSGFLFIPLFEVEGEADFMPFEVDTGVTFSFLVFPLIAAHPLTCRSYSFWSYGKVFYCIDR